MGRGSHLLAQSVGGSIPARGSPRPAEETRTRVTFCVAWAFSWLGFVVLLAAIFVLLLFGFDLLRGFFVLVRLLVLGP